MTGSVLVTTAPVPDPGLGRTEITLPEGMTIAQMIERAYPGISASDHDQLRVYLVTPLAKSTVDPQYWHCTRPRPGVRLLIRMVPGKNAIRTVLLVAVTVAAVAVGQFYAGSFLGVAGLSATGAALLTAGLTVVGTLLVNALIPVKPSSQGGSSTKAQDVYTISGFRNSSRPGDPVPLVLGRHRYAPPFAAGSYSEIVGDKLYVRALFCAGYGPNTIYDLRIGDTPVSDFDNIDIETREGWSTDAPITLYPRQVIEENTGVDLIRPLPRDDAGNIVDGPGTETPVTRFTAGDATEASIILAFPAGLFSVDDNNNVVGLSVSVRIRQRLEGEGDWSDVATLDISSSKREPIYRQHSWALPTRGRYEIEVTRMTDERTSTTTSDRTSFVAIQSIRPEAPINSALPLTLIAMRVKATYQLNGPLDNVNAVFQRYGKVRDG
ncbi:TipJ family phage tail tip protein, partial [Acidimangrovimonas sediminis]